MTWKDITIEKYNQIAALQNEGKEEITQGVSNPMSELDLIASTIAILLGKRLEEVEEMPYAELLMRARQLRFLNGSPIPSMVKKSYTLDGKKYITTINPANLTTAQYIDFQVKAADAPEDLAGLLAVLLIPDGHKYNEDYDSEELRDTIYRFMPIEDALGLSAFFFTLWKRSIRRLLRENKRQYRKLSRKRDKTKEEQKLLEAIKRLIETIEKVQRYY